jgi:hypothetical protein
LGVGAFDATVGVNVAIGAIVGNVVVGVCVVGTDVGNVDGTSVGTMVGRVGTVVEGVDVRTFFVGTVDNFVGMDDGSSVGSDEG